MRTGTLVPLFSTFRHSSVQIDVDGFESRLAWCISARDEGPSGGRVLELGGHGGEEGTSLAVPSEALDRNG